MDAATPPPEHGTLPVADTRFAPVARVADPQPAPPAWLAEARAELTGPGRYLAYEEDGGRVVVSLGRSTRIGRSLSADIRFDDATVSRRHALLLIEDETARIVDDRSLNGVHVNGRRVDSAALADGDEVGIGRYALYYLDTTAVPAAGAPVPVALAE